MLFRDKFFGAIRLRHGSLRYRYDFTMAHHSSLTALLCLCYGSVPGNPEIRLIRVTNRQSKGAPLSPGNPPSPHSDCRAGFKHIGVT